MKLRLSDVPKVTQLVRGRAGIHAQTVWLQSMSSGPKCSTVSALPFWKDVNELVCMAPTGECMCVCVYTCEHAHTCISIPAMGGKAQGCTHELLCVDGCTCAFAGAQGDLTCALLPSLPSWLPGDGVPALSGVELLSGLLPNPVERLQVPRKELGSETKSGQGPGRSRSEGGSMVAMCGLLSCASQCLGNLCAAHIMCSCFQPLRRHRPDWASSWCLSQGQDCGDK